jgi:ActR/RegA family two-component response regulator/energy-coupling factor transporter ATP-binding protein EcfA2
MFSCTTRHAPGLRCALMPVEPDHPTHTREPAADLVALLKQKVIGQPNALQYIAPYIQMYQAGLNPMDRPAGIFLLLGPTGTGKTRTVEALAEILHGSVKHLLKIDCGEFQSDHEVAKLIGAPPGYIGHRESKPLLSQERLLGIVTPGCDLSIVLFDEIEKAAPAVTTLLLGILDRATLRQGDNTTVNFEKSLIFLTSNLGAREMAKEVKPEIGFIAGDSRSAAEITGRLESIGLAAVRKRFSPEFVNRIDVVITYQPLDTGALAEILDHHLDELQRHVHRRLGERSFDIEVTTAARQLLLGKGASIEYGARELKRTIHRMLTQPLATLVADQQVQPGGRVLVDAAADRERLTLRPERLPDDMPERSRPVVLVLDENAQLVDRLERELATAGVAPLVAASAEQGREIARRQRVDLTIVDLMLPDGDGLSVAFALLRMWPRLRIVLLTGMELSPDEVAICERQDIPVLRKPFLAEDVVRFIQPLLLNWPRRRNRETRFTSEVASGNRVLET